MIRLEDSKKEQEKKVKYDDDNDMFVVCMCGDFFFKNTRSLPLLTYSPYLPYLLTISAGIACN